MASVDPCDTLRMFLGRRKPDDVIMAILANLNRDRISSDPAIFHEAVFRLAQEAEFQSLLSDFVFDEGSLTPFSDLLDRVLFRLESSFLGTLNPEYAVYDLKGDGTRGLLSAARERFDDAERSTLDRAGRRFAEIIVGLTGADGHA